MSSDDDNDELKQPSRKKMKLKRKSETQPLILAICTPIIASDEQESTVRRGLQLLGEVLPKEAFNGTGIKPGPSIVMTALWNVQLFIASGQMQSFFYAPFTFFNENGHGCMMQRIGLLRLIELYKGERLVYAKTEDQLNRKYAHFHEAPEVCKYPHFALHIKKTVWPRRTEWAHCFRQSMEETTQTTMLKRECAS